VKNEEEEFEEQSEELFEHHSFKVDKGQEMIRIDKFLLDRMPKTSRNRIQNSCKSGNVLVNNNAVKQNYKVKPGDLISIVLPYPIREIELIPQDIPIDIVYEDDDLSVVNKPANMVVHPAYGNYTGTLVNALMYHFQNLPDKKEGFFGRPGLVHRIDKHTTGLLVIAKTEYALTNLAKQFFDKSTKRKYWALVWGNVKEEEGTIRNYLGRSPKNRKLITVFNSEDEGKLAITHYKVLERFNYFTLVECQLETGRTHQIRVHMKHIGHPLFHDLEYGGDSVLVGPNTANYKKFIQNCFELIPGQALHAKTLGFVHPETNEELSFESELPEGYKMLIDKIKKFDQ
jgi:23S rRNA pseudouridine1911/1915/1917 synthase